MTEPTTGPAVGSRIGDFIIEDRLGRGGMGEVFRATQVRLKRPVALKVLSALPPGHPEFAARFAREATTLRDLEHPSVVTVYDTGEHGGVLYIAMRLLERATLRDRLDAGAMAPGPVLDVLRPLASALDHAHAHGVVHRDIKPANVLFDRDGRPYLADFGIAKAIDDVAVTLSGSALGTPLYMSPEQFRGEAGHRSDLYSFACVAFQMLTGSPPYPLSAWIPLRSAHEDAPVPSATERVPELPAAVDEVFTRGLAKAPTQRYASAAEFVEALTAAVTGTGPTAPMPPTDARTTTPASSGSAPTGPRPRRRPAPWVLVAAAVTVVLALVGLLVATRSGAGVSGSADSGTTESTTDSTAPGSGAALDETDTLVPAVAPADGREPPIHHGPLLFAPPFDDKGTGFLLPTDLDPARGEAARAVPGALELEVGGNRGYIYVQHQVPGLSTYVADADIAIRPGSTARLCWSLRWAVPGELAWYWCLDTQFERAGFRTFSDGAFTAVGDTVTVPGLQSGRTVRISLVVRATHLTMYLDGQPVRDVDDTAVPVAATVPGFELSGRVGAGAVRITHLQVWAL